MNEFLDQLSKELGQTHAIIVMDRAAWHKSKTLKIPENIKIIYLPPYSPELNPVEKLWQHMKAHTIKNRIYEDIKSLENAICAFINTFTQDAIKQTCSLNHCLN